MDFGKQSPGHVTSPVASIMQTMTQEQFDLWADLLKERTGMVLPVQRKSFLVTSLDLRMREIGCNTFEEYYDVLNSGVNGELEWKFLIDRLTVHETRFFRHQDSLDLIRKFIAEKPVDPKTGKVTVQIWSVACSTGEEAYTLGMVVDQALHLRKEETYYGVIATDISQPAIKSARSGVYSKRRIKGVDEPLLNQYFKELDNDRYQVNQELRKRVCFSPMNVLDIRREIIGKIDIIFCQNLLIYFDRDKRYEIVNTLENTLNPGGIIILGSGELVQWGHPEMRKMNHQNTLAFQRDAD
jgi:chemotaxis protein methyltransferase CheR/type IV pilus assembly protein PilK